jgi:hypothetical protein
MTTATTSSTVHTERESERASDCRKPRVSAGGPSSAAGTFWCAGWLFTIGFVKLVWWKAVLALLLWPYFMGVTLAR